MEDKRHAAEQAVQRTILEAGLAGERLVCWARMVFCVAIVLRSIGHVLFSPFDAPLAASLITYPALGVAVLFSVLVLLGLGRRAHTNLVLHLSVTIDALVAFTVLLTTALWPGPGYQGAPFMIDTATLLLVVMTSGLRQSVTAAALAGVLGSLALAGLAVVDHLDGVSTVDLARGYSMFGVVLAGVAAVALMIAVRTRRLVTGAARAAVAAERAGAGLRDLLRDHHDLRTVVTSAQINADLLARGDSTAADVVAHLRDDLGELRTQLEQAKGRALEELAGLDEPSAVPVGDAARAVVSALGPRFPAVALHATAADGAAAMVAGGSPTLHRILANLVVNACEGDGRRGAQRVDVVARPAGDRVAIEVIDDGPGLPTHVLAAAPGGAPSTKASGSGFGIGLVDGLVRASGGRVAWDNRSEGGARVLVELPAAP